MQDSTNDGVPGDGAPVFTIKLVSAYSGREKRKCTTNHEVDYEKVFAVLSLVLCFGVTMAFAVDGAELYKTRCAKCHRDGSESSKAGGGVVLKGQSADEVEMKLKGYLDGTYGGKRNENHGPPAEKILPRGIRAMSEHVGSL